MRYEEKYKNALERARECMKDGGISQNTIDYLCNIFPELAESEDEKIRKALIDYFNKYKEQKECGINTFYGIPTDNILAWLEKQGEPKTELVDEDEIYWLAWVIGGLPDTEQANEAEAVLKELLEKLKAVKGCKK